MTTHERVPRYYPIKVVEIELSRPVETIHGLEGYAALKGLVRLQGAPLGYVQLAVTNGCCPAETIGSAILEHYSWKIIHHLISASLATPLQDASLRLSDLVHAPQGDYAGPFPLVTVAVCARDRTADLAICLNAISRLDYPSLDLLVVDNAPSTGETEALVREQYPQVRYICEPRPGLSWARNRAILEARGEIIAFTDDDVIVDAGWVKALAQTFVECPDAMALTGLVAPYELETEPQILFEVNGGFGRGFNRQWHQFQAKTDRQSTYYHGAGKFGTGANMAFRCKLFSYIGNFDPSLGVGTATNGGEDIEMFFRLLHAGYTLVYEPNALVRHRHRRDYSSLRRQLSNNAIGLSSFHVRSALAYPDQRGKFVRLQLWWLFHWHIKRLLQSLTRPHRVPRDLIWAELGGYLVGLFRYRAAQHQTTEVVNRFGALPTDTTGYRPESVITYFA